MPAPRVFLIGFNTFIGRQVLQGIRTYLQGRPPWEIYVVPASVVRATLHGLLTHHTAWRPDGMIAMVRTPELQRKLTRLRIPVVNTSGVFEGGLPRVSHDNPAIGHMAAEHLLKRGLRQFAFVCLTWEWYVKQRYEGFATTIRRADFPVTAFKYFGRAQEPRNYIQYQVDLRNWLCALEKPVGILASYDDQAQEVLWACQQAGLNVPHDVAVVGVENEEQICSISIPAISSVETGAWRIGSEAAAALQRMMRGARPPSAPVLVPPLHVVERQSSDLVATDDPRIATAIRFIRERANQPIGVADILKQVHMSRRTFERRFAKVVGCSPRAEIDRIRLDRARKLLVETDQPIPAVAVAAGFLRPANFTAFFRRKTGQTPSGFRKRLRAR